MGPCLAAHCSKETEEKYTPAEAVPEADLRLKGPCSVCFCGDASCEKECPLGKQGVTEACRTAVYAMGAMRALTSAVLPKMDVGTGPGILRKRHRLSKLSKYTTACSQGVLSKLWRNCGRLAGHIFLRCQM